MQTTISQAEYQALLKKQPKYGNRKTIVDGVTFDSAAEAKRYRELLLLEAAGQIEDLVLQPVYELQAGFRDASGKRHRAITYRGDFGYTEVIDPQSVQGRAVCEDVKGARTKEFNIKEKLFRFRYPAIDLRVMP